MGVVVFEFSSAFPPFHASTPVEISRISSRGTSRGPRRRARQEKAEKTREIRRIPATKRRTRACPPPRRISSRVCCIRTHRSVSGRGPARRTSRRTRSSPESTGIRCSRTARLVRTRRLRLRARICPCSSPRSTATPTRAISSVSPRAAGSQPTALPRTGAGRYSRSRRSSLDGTSPSESRRASLNMGAFWCRPRRDRSGGSGRSRRRSRRRRRPRLCGFRVSPAPGEARQPPTEAVVPGDRDVRLEPVVVQGAEHLRALVC